VLKSFLSFLKKILKNKAHKMFSLMLDPRFKILCLVSSFIGKEQNVAIIEKYDKKSSYPMLLKRHHHLHLLAKTKSYFANIGVDEEYNLDIFEQTANISEPMKELVHRKLFIFK